MCINPITQCKSILPFAWTMNCDFDLTGLGLDCTSTWLSFDQILQAVDVDAETIEANRCSGYWSRIVEDGTWNINMHRKQLSHYSLNLQLSTYSKVLTFSPSSTATTEDGSGTQEPILGFCDGVVEILD